MKAHELVIIIGLVTMVLWVVMQLALRQEILP